MRIFFVPVIILYNWMPANKKEWKEKKSASVCAIKFWKGPSSSSSFVKDNNWQTNTRKEEEQRISVFSLFEKKRISLPLNLNLVEIFLVFAKLFAIIKKIIGSEIWVWLKRICLSYMIGYTSEATINFFRGKTQFYSNFLLYISYVFNGYRPKSRNKSNYSETYCRRWLNESWRKAKKEFCFNQRRVKERSINQVLTNKVGPSIKDIYCR